MCGVAGLLSSDRELRAETLEHLSRTMSGAQCHRGPDDSGEWTNSSSGIALSHRRLSILGPGAAGRQPMISKSGRYVITYNGEVYNFRELRQSLTEAGSVFTTQTDTEVLLEAIDAWGIVSTLKRINGMFGFGLWDRTEKRLYLARDAFGIKPLYIGFVDRRLMFASEVQAIKKASPKLEIEVKALDEYLRCGFISSPLCIYKGFAKLIPGTVLCYSSENEAVPDGFSPAQKPFEEPSFRSVSILYFWNYEQELEKGASIPFSLTEAEAANELDILLRRVVSRQSVSDVPIGAFLSGGIDSSTVVALLQSVSSTPVKTYTIGFENSRLDESEYAKQVANHLGTFHTELRVSENKALEAAKRVGRIYDEPFADSSQIPTFMVSELAAGDVKVVLTGDGGDEIFGGYDRHVQGIGLWRKIQSLPPSAREALLKLAESSYWTGADAGVPSILQNWIPALNHRSLENTMGKITKVAASRSIRDLYLNLTAITTRPTAAITGPDERYSLPLDQGASLDDSRHLMLLDSIHYLPDDILAKVDRATMAHSLEARVPFLDLEVAQFAAKLPTNYLVKGTSGKKIVKEVLQRYLPTELIKRPKMGFAVPLAEWLRGPLKDWSSDTLASADLKLPGLVDWKNIRDKAEAFYSGSENTSAVVWSYVMLAEWLQVQ